MPSVNHSGKINLLLHAIPRHDHPLHRVPGNTCTLGFIRTFFLEHRQVLFVFDVLRLMTGPAGSLPKPEAAFSMLVHGILNMDKKGNDIALSSNFSGPDPNRKQLFRCWFMES